jgi:anti-anti-sigma factor
MDMDLMLTSEVDELGRSVMVVSGAIDLASREQFLSVGAAAIKSTSAREFVLELSGVTFLDSLGVGALVRLDQLAGQADKTIVLARPAPRVVRLLEMVGLRDLWRVEAS